MDKSNNYGIYIKLNNGTKVVSSKVGVEDINKKLKDIKIMLDKYDDKFKDGLKSQYMYLSNYDDKISGNHNNILAYNFCKGDTFNSIRFYETIHKFEIMAKNDKVLILSDNQCSTDSIIYYKKYQLNEFSINRINLILFNDSSKKIDKDIIYTNKIKFTPINSNTSDLGKEIIESLSKNTFEKSYNLIIIDLGLDEIFSILDKVISKLVIGGSIVIKVHIIGNNDKFDKLSSLGSNFKESFIYFSELPFIDNNSSMFVFKEFIGDSKNNSLQRSQSYLHKGVYNQYIENVLDSFDTTKKIILENISLTNDNESVNNNLLYSIEYANRIGLEVATWVDTDNYLDMTLKHITNIIEPFIFRLEKGNNDFDINVHNSLKYHDKKHITNLYMLSENAFKYTENVNFKHVELWFNKLQKKLSHTLFNNHNIKINKSKVTRAWIKLYELYGSTNYFDNLINNNKKIRALHICEAPGNFVASSIHYTSKLGLEYDWTAQSLVDGDIFDSHGFIKDNEDKWDFNSSGDITTSLRYYYEKYKDVDSCVGDCGVPWESGKLQPSKNISVFQLIYCLLLPRLGGNFVIKTYATNFDMLYLSLVYTACVKYDKVYIFRSSRNFWSPEIYIVGIGKKKLKELEIKALFEIADGLTKDKITYPIDFISAEFGLEYEYYMQHIIKSYTDVKKFIVYLARNKKVYDKVRNELIEYFEKKNKMWMKKYLDL